MEDLPNWKYNNEEITNIDQFFRLLKKHNAKTLIADNIKDLKNPWEIYGFIYKLTLEHDDGTLRYYIGKKNLTSYEEKRARRNHMPRLGHIKFKMRRKEGKLVEYEYFMKESDWLEYRGSSDYCKEHKVLEREIIDIAESKFLLTFLECKHLFMNDCLTDPNYVNLNILGTFYRDKLLIPPVMDVDLTYFIRKTEIEHLPKRKRPRTI